MNIKPINPWTWQDAFGFSQAFEVTAAGQVLFCSGQASVDANGNPLHAQDMQKQLSQAFDNLEVVLAHAGMTLENVVRLNFYTTDMAAFFKATPQVLERVGGTKPPGTLLGVAALFHPDILIEIEATAVS
jgi:enamine deaminase RidA (YjgF/YER057c/UK114 family)